jgi:hypothetical protein
MLDAVSPVDPMPVSRKSEILPKTAPRSKANTMAIR